MIERSLNPNEIISLLSKLKDQTPDYPPDLLAARKAAFLKQVVTIKLDSPGKGGGDGGGSLSAGSGGSGALGGMSAAQSILLQATIGVWIIAAMLTASYFFRDEIINLLQDYGIVAVEVTQAPSLDSPAPDLESPAIEAPSPDVLPTDTPSPSEAIAPENASSEESSSEDSSSEGQDPASGNTEDDKDDQGLHLGQTPGAPDTPNQSNPDKQDKPEKPENPNKPDKKK